MECPCTVCWVVWVRLGVLVSVLVSVVTSSSSPAFLVEVVVDLPVRSSLLRSVRPDGAVMVTLPAPAMAVVMSRRDWALTVVATTRRMAMASRRRLMLCMVVIAM